MEKIQFVLVFSMRVGFADLCFQGERSRAVLAGAELKVMTSSTENTAVQPCRLLHLLSFCPYTDPPSQAPSIFIIISSPRL